MAINFNSDEDLGRWFTYHAPKPEQLPKYQVIRKQARILATTIRDLCPPGPDATVAIRKIREAVMTANAAIACERDGLVQLQAKETEHGDTPQGR